MFGLNKSKELEQVQNQRELLIEQIKSVLIKQDAFVLSQYLVAC
ncbi:MAG: hypothetical protein Q4G58_08955 [bacterium]|nr:hypothetical protein [bacterium]